MPRIRVLIPNLAHSWTKVPNILFDKLMPDLKDTELRVLLLMIRQTNGYGREGRAVILPYHQLTKRTGRASEAVSLALKSLATRGLIHKPKSNKQRSNG